MNAARFIERKYTVEILQKIAENPGINKTGIIRMNPKGERSRAVRINQLVDMGFVKEEPYGPNGFHLYLTKEGEAIYSIVKPLLDCNLRVIV